MPTVRRRKISVDDSRELIRSVGLDVARQLSEIVGGGIENTDFKLRDVTGALRDLGDVLGVKNAAEAGHAAPAESGQFVIRLEGVSEEWMT